MDLHDKIKMDVTLSEITKEESLVQMGVTPPKNYCTFILRRIIYFLFNPKKYSQWLKTIFLDLKYSRAYLGIRVYNGNLSLGRTGSASSNYRDLTTLFSNITIKKNDVIVDVGCGKGRVLNFLLSKNINTTLIGIEADPSIAVLTKKKFRRYTHIKILTGAAEDEGMLPITGTIFYLFNPFSEDVMKKFSNQLEKNIKYGYCKNEARPLILYYYCYHIHVFEENPLWEVKKLNDVFAAIILPKNAITI